MNQKWWLDSRTVRGVLVTIIPMLSLILKSLGIEIGDADQQQFVDGIVALIGLVGAVYAIVGRFKASKSLTVTKP